MYSGCAGDGEGADRVRADLTGGECSKYCGLFLVLRKGGGESWQCEQTFVLTCGCGSGHEHPGMSHTSVGLGGC